MLLYFIMTDILLKIIPISINDFFRKIFNASFYGVYLFVLSKSLLLLLLLTKVLNFQYVVDHIYPVINYTPVGSSISIVGSRFSFLRYCHLRLLLHKT